MGNRSGSQSSPDPVAVQRHGAVLLVTVAHPPANAISLAVLAGIRRALDEAVEDRRSGAVVLTGEGAKFFSAGADLKEVASEGEALRSGGQSITLAIESCPLPVIAAVNGIALGGGCELALAADIRIAATTASFGQPEVNLGIMPGWGGTQRLSRLVGSAQALALLLSGESVAATRALELGLVSRVVEPERLLAEAIDLAATLAAKAPLAVAAIKRAVREGTAGSQSEGLAVENRELSLLLATEDAVEGVVAFLEKRAPRWRGR